MADIPDLQDFDKNGIYNGPDHGRADFPKGPGMTSEQKRIMSVLEAKKDRTRHEESVLHGLKGLAKRVVE